MTELEAREFFGLFPDDRLNDYGQKCIEAMADVPARDPERDQGQEQIRIFSDFLKASVRLGIHPPPKGVKRDGA